MGARRRFLPGSQKLFVCEDGVLRRTQPIAAKVEEASGSDFRAANEGRSAFASLRRSQPSPVDLMREALDEPETEPVPEHPMRRASDFVAAPALPLEEEPVAFVVKPSSGRAGRRAMDDLREQALRNIIASAQVGAAPPKRSQLGRGPFTPSRIILLSVALIAGGVAAFLAAQLAEPAAPAAAPEVVVAATTQVLVAKDTIGIGQRVTATAVEWIDWPDSAVQAEFVTSTAAPDAIAEMEGSVARSEILPGEPILEQKLARPDGSYLAGVLDSGMRGVSLPVTAASASGGFIAPNDRVDVISTRTLEMRKVSDTILRNVRVLAINGQLGQADGDAAEDVEQRDAFSGETLATLELDPAQSELVINAMAVGELTLVLRSITDVADGLTSEQRAANQAIRASSPFWQ